MPQSVAVVKRSFSDKIYIRVKLNRREFWVLAECRRVDIHHIVVYRYSFEIVALGKAHFGHEIGVQIDGRKSRLYKRAVRQLCVRAQNHRLNVDAVSEHIAACVAKRRKVDGAKSRASFKRAYADGIAFVEIDFFKRRASVKSSCAYCFHVFEIDSLQLAVVVECVFPKVSYFALYFHFLQFGAVVKSVFFYFLNGIGNNNLFDCIVGAGNFVFIPVVFVYFDVAVGGVQAERIRAYIQHAFVFGNFHHAVFGDTLIRNQFVIFDDEGILDGDTYTRHNVRAGQRRHDGGRALFYRRNASVLIHRRNGGVGGRKGYGIFVRHIPRIEIAFKIYYFARVHGNGAAGRGNKGSRTRFAYVGRSRCVVVSENGVKISKSQCFDGGVVDVGHSVARSGGGGCRQRLRFSRQCSLFVFRHAVRYGICCGRGIGHTAAGANVDDYGCLSCRQHFAGNNSASQHRYGRAAGRNAPYKAFLDLGDFGIGALPREIFEIIFIGIELFVGRRQQFGKIHHFVLVNGDDVDGVAFHRAVAGKLEVAVRAGQLADVDVGIQRIVVDGECQSSRKHGVVSHVFKVIGNFKTHRVVRILGRIYGNGRIRQHSVR